MSERKVYVARIQKCAHQNVIKEGDADVDEYDWGRCLDCGDRGFPLERSSDLLVPRATLRLAIEALRRTRKAVKVLEFALAEKPTLNMVDEALKALREALGEEP